MFIDTCGVRHRAEIVSDVTCVDPRVDIAFCGNNDRFLSGKCAAPFVSRHLYGLAVAPNENATTDIRYSRRNVSIKVNIEAHLPNPLRLVCSHGAWL